MQPPNLTQQMPAAAHHAPLQPMRIAVLHGGPSSEHDISVWSSRGVISTLRAAEHAVVAAYVDAEGQWHIHETAEAGTRVDAPVDVFAAVKQLIALQIQVCFMGFHGTYGEDGKIQAVLELAGLAYTGSRVAASAVAMDKPLARRVFVGCDLRIAQGEEVHAAAVATPDLATVVGRRLIAEWGLPVVVKVPAGGSSVGVEIANNLSALADALLRLAAIDGTVLCEQYIGGTELTAAVIEQRDGSLLSLPIVEITPAHGKFFDYQAKYAAGGSEEIVPARISDAATALAQDYGRRAHNGLHCNGYSRTDLILRTDGHLFVLETNTLPGLTPASLLPKAAAAAGFSYLALIERMIVSALRSR